MTDIETLTSLVRQASEDIGQTEITADELSPEFQELGTAICACLRQMQEVYRFTEALGDGDFSVPVPSRSNYMAGPAKDLFYMLKHVAWQAEQAAGGDYSQRVDFMGSFSDSFNRVLAELERQHRQLRACTGEPSAALQSGPAYGRTERLLCHYNAYRDYIASFQTFREHYKAMMGEVYALFDAGKYDEGRLLITKINDRMASEVIVSKQYSNHDIVNAALTDIGSLCRSRGIRFQAQVYIPPSFRMEPKYTLDFIVDLSDLVLSLVGVPDHAGQSVTVGSQLKGAWLTVSVGYHAQRGAFPERIESMIGAESLEQINRIETAALATGSLFHMDYSPKELGVELFLHLCTGC